MSAPRSSGTFGLDSATIKDIDWKLAVDRILSDLKSDFIYAPHLRFIYARARDGLIDLVKRELTAGTFSVGLPLTIDVPKSNRIRVSRSKRLGPNFTRPGSILWPQDRLLYQAIGNQISQKIDENYDKERSFSHVLDKSNSETMFASSRSCWNNLQQALARHAESEDISYVIKLDIANYFGSINQHILVNILSDIGCDRNILNRLEAMLTDLTGHRSSRGIIQGLYTSDLLGNFYMMPMDRFFEDYGVESARYVDDVYVFVGDYNHAYDLVRGLIPELRSYDLILNESKTYILPKSLLVTEEPDLEKLFNEAVTEISSQIDDEDLSDDYGFQMNWEDDVFDDSEDENEDADEEVEPEVHLKATEILFDSISEYPGHEESIERFCIPIFQKVLSDYAVEHVMIFFDDRPSMTQVYSSYLSSFIDRQTVRDFLSSELGNSSYGDWQRMWILAGLLQSDDVNADAMRAAYSILIDANHHEGLRAVAAIFVGKYGDYSRRRNLINIYATVSEYIKSAIYFSSMYWGPAEKNNAKSSWGMQGPLNRLITQGFGKKSS